MKRLREAGHSGPTIMNSILKIMCFLNIKACQHILLHQIHKIMIFKKASYDHLSVVSLIANATFLHHRLNIIKHCLVNG